MSITGNELVNIAEASTEKRFDAVQIQALTQLHCAEYQALTNRNTYSILIQSSFWGMIVFYVTLIGLVWPKTDTYRPVLVWGSGIVLQLFALAIGSFSLEQYNNIGYLEHVLRPIIASMVSTDSFWGYEQHLSRQRGDHEPWWESLLPIGAGIVIVIAAIFRWLELQALPEQFSFRLVAWDIAGVVVNAVLLVLVFKLKRRLNVIRKNMTAKAPSVKPESLGRTEDTQPRQVSGV